jgi:hypothetical protein
MAIKTLDEIADKFDYHRNTVGKWFARPDAPKKGKGGFDFDEVAEFVKARALEGKEKSAAKADPGVANLKVAELEEKIRKLKIANDAADKKLIPITSLHFEISEMASEVQKRMYAIPPRAPELAGLSVPDIEAKLTAWMDEIVAALGNDRTKPNAEPVES